MSYSNLLLNESDGIIDNDSLEASNEECYLGDRKIDRPSHDGWEAAAFAKEDFATAGDGIYHPRMIPPFPKDTSGFDDDHNSTPEPEEEFVDIITIPARNAESDQWTEEDTPMGESYYDDSDDDEFFNEALSEKWKKRLKIGAAVGAGAVAAGTAAAAAKGYSKLTPEERQRLKDGYKVIGRDIHAGAVAVPKSLIQYGLQRESYDYDDGDEELYESYDYDDYDDGDEELYDI